MIIIRNEKKWMTYNYAHCKKSIRYMDGIHCKKSIRYMDGIRNEKKWPIILWMLMINRPQAWAEPELCVTYIEHEDLYY